MHRSGTSAFSGTLNQLGISMGKEMLDAVRENPKGFFENKKVYDFNDLKLLPLLGTSWDDIADLPEEWLDRDEVKALYAEAEAIVHDDYSDLQIFGMKDPRICILFPFWKQVLQNMDIEVKCILPYRNPLEVAKSLLTRNDFSTEKSLVLWTKYNLYAEYYSRNSARVFVSYENLLNEVQPTLAHIAAELKIDFPNSPEEQMEKLRTFLQKSLKREHATRVLADDVPSFIRTCDGLFQSVIQSHVDDKALKDAFDKVREEYQSLSAYMLNKDTRPDIEYRVRKEMKRNRADRRFRKWVKSKYRK